MFPISFIAEISRLAESTWHGGCHDQGHGKGEYVSDRCVLSMMGVRQHDVRCKIGATRVSDLSEAVVRLESCRKDLRHSRGKVGRQLP